jgi:hypothetical protein
LLHKIRRKVAAIALSHNDKFLAGSILQGVYIWSVATGQLLHGLRADVCKMRPYILAWAPDSRYLIHTSATSDVFLWGLDEKVSVSVRACITFNFVGVCAS